MEMCMKVSGMMLPIKETVKERRYGQTVPFMKVTGGMTKQMEMED
jgi:hypothetical protein